MDRKQRKEEKKQKKLDKFAKKQEFKVIAKSGRSSKQKIKNQEILEKTPDGELKNLNKEMGAYDPLIVEEGWYSWWQKQLYFKPEKIKQLRNKTKGPYTIPIPPPNVTGKLHIGHAMMISIQDAIARYKRMLGYEVLFVPGTDHAGIATQTVVEKKLYAQQKKSRYDLGREKFIDLVWEWKEEHGNAIMNQIQRMGASVDMDRFVFTLDDKRNESVKEAFVELYNRKLIYRDEKLINWSSKLATAISDLEVDHKTIKPNTKIFADNKEYNFGILYHFKYPIAKKETTEISEYIEIATTRPETIIGDTALCVNPNDPRADQLKNKNAINPITMKQIPIIFDDFANLEFGTGVVKITPGHDFNDFDLAKKHNLQILQVLNEKNEILHEGDFIGMKRFDARIKIVEFLKKQKLFVSTEGYEQILPICSRSGDILEPLLKKQWWMNCKEMAKKSIEAVENGKLKIIPPIAIKQWNFWLGNIRDWCLSRQLWWGHRIPAYRILKDNEFVGWIIAKTNGEAEKKAIKEYKLEKNTFIVQQDEDVLDTWFSSALWPFSIFEWPKKTKDFKKYFPASILETGSDILFFWVARMVMCSLELQGKLPFDSILLHGIVRDANGRKMSKSLGNVIDPIHVIEGVDSEKLAESIISTNLDKKEIKKALDGQKKDFPNGIPRCGADALRFTLCSYTSGLKDINLNILRADGYRKFCNKIWNAFKFVSLIIEKSELNRNEMNKFYDLYVKGDSSRDLSECFEKMDLSSFNSSKAVIEWLMMHRNATIQEYIIEMGKFVFMNVTQAIHQFTLYKFCDVFIEITKNSNNLQQIAATVFVFRDILLMLHPFMPFITEELFQRLRKYQLFDLEESITIASFPEPTKRTYTQNDFSLVITICKTIRSMIDTKSLDKVKVSINDENIIMFKDEIMILCKNVSELIYEKEIKGKYIEKIDKNIQIGVYEIA